MTAVLTVFKLNGCLFIFFNRIPFIDDQDNAFLRLLDETSNMLILGCNTRSGIDDQQGYIAAFYGLHCAQNAVFLAY